MIKKYALFAFLSIVSISAMAQKTEYEMPDIYGLGNGPSTHKTSFAADLGIGSEVSIGLRLQRNFNKYISWDILSCRYAYDYVEESPEDFDHEVVVATGVRAFTNTFGRRNMKFYGNLNLGYGYSEYESHHYYYNYNYDYVYDYHYSDSSHNFALGFGLGLFLTRKFYIGYDLQLFIGDIVHSDHTLRIGYQF